MESEFLSAFRPGSERRPWDVFDRAHFYGLVALFVGLSQVLLALEFMNRGRLVAEYAPIVIGAGGWLLVGIGLDLLGGGHGFENRDRHGWLTVAWMAFALLYTAVVLVASVNIALSG